MNTSNMQSNNPKTQNKLLHHQQVCNHYTNANSETEIVYVKDFPPGYHFQPTDYELIVYYLKKKVENEPIPYSRIHEVDIYKHNPKELSDMFSHFGEKKWYFFTPRDRKYLNGSRPSRAASNGYWKATVGDKAIHHNNKIVGSKKSLVFYEGKPPKAKKTNWLMQEYMVHEPNPKRNSTSDARLDEWVLCRIYKRDGQKDKDGDLDRQPNENSPAIEENLATIACDYEENLATAMTCAYEENLATAMTYAYEENLATAMTCDYEENLATMHKDKDGDLDPQPNENPKACDYEEHLATAMTCYYEENLATMHKDKDGDLDPQPNEKACDYEEHLATAMTCYYEENLATIQKDKDGDLDQQPNENSLATDKACDYGENLATMACDYIGMVPSNGLMKRLGIDLTQTCPPIFPSLAISYEDNHATMACDNIDITQSNDEGLMDRSSIWENSINIPSVYTMGNGLEKRDLLEDWDFWQDAWVPCD